MKNQVHIDVNPSSVRVKQLTAILYLLQSNLEEFIDEVDKGYDLFTKIGEKTELVQSIEKMIDNPLGNLSQLSERISYQIKFIIDKTVKAFFVQKKELISKVVINSTVLNNLHYSIVLKEDNMENRLAVFDFLSFYDALEISSNYPISFQFVPVALIGKIKGSEEYIPS